MGSLKGPLHGHNIAPGIPRTSLFVISGFHVSHLASLELMAPHLDTPAGTLQGTLAVQPSTIKPQPLEGSEEARPGHSHPLPWPTQRIHIYYHYGIRSLKLDNKNGLLGT